MIQFTTLKKLLQKWSLHHEKRGQSGKGVKIQGFSVIKFKFKNFKLNFKKKSSSSEGK